MKELTDILSDLVECIHTKEKELAVREKELEVTSQAHPVKTYATAQGAKLLSISISQLTELARSGEIPAAKISNSWVFRETSLIEYLTRKENE